MSVSRVLWPTVEAIALDEFVGITADGQLTPDLFSIESTGASTQPVVEAANHFVGSLTEQQRAKTLYPVDDLEWQRWANIHLSTRQGAGFEEFDRQQTEAALAMIASGLSAYGMQTATDIMRLEGHLADLMNDYV